MEIYILALNLFLISELGFGISVCMCVYVYFMKNYIYFVFSTS